MSRRIEGTLDDKLYQTDRFGQGFSYEIVSHLIDVLKSYSGLAFSLIILFHFTYSL